MKHVMIGILSCLVLLGTGPTGCAETNTSPSVTSSENTKQHPFEIVTEQCMAKENYTTAGMLTCLDKEYTAWDAELNRLYTQLRAQLSTAGKQALTAAQRKWIEQRDLEFVFIDARYAGSEFEGSMWGPIILQHKIDVIRKRVEGVASYLNPLQQEEEGV